MLSRIARISLVLVVCTVIVASGSQLFAGKPGGGGTGCPSGRFCLCANFECPVTCNGGCRYPNPCVADCAGATGCVITGPCGVEVPL